MSVARRTLPLALLILAACDDPGVATVSGSWVATFEPPLAPHRLELVLDESSSGRITGTGTLTPLPGAPGEEVVALTITGTHSRSFVTLDLDGQVEIRGTLDGDRIDGELFGGGFQGEPITLMRPELPPASP